MLPRVNSAGGEGEDLRNNLPSQDQRGSSSLMPAISFGLMAIFVGFGLPPLSSLRSLLETTLSSGAVALLPLLPFAILWQRRGVSRRASKRSEEAQAQPPEPNRDRKLYEQEHALTQFVQQLGRLHELEAILAYVAKQFSQKLPVGRVAIFLGEKSNEEPKLATLATHGDILSLPEQRLPFQGMVGQAFEQGATRLENLPRAETGERIVNLALPLRQSGRTAGVILFEELRLAPDKSEEISLAERLVELAEPTIRQALALRQMEQRARAWEKTLTDTWTGLEKTLDDLADPAFIHSPDYTILRFNKALQHRLARPTSAILGQKCYEILFHKSAPCSYCPYRAEEREPQAHQAEVPQPRERSKLLILSVSRVNAEGESLGALEIVRDSTMEQRWQDQLLHSEKLASIGKLVSGVAHELNNPLTAILGHAQLLERRAEDSRVKEKVKMILEEAGRASRIVRNLLTFARKQRPEQQVIDLNEVVRKTLALREYELKSNQIQIVLRLAPHLAAVVGDFQQMQQVLLNLISNAEQAMLETHGRGTLTIETFAEENRACMKVGDDGPGIPADSRQRIFDPFFTTKAIGKGTGLGLSICFGILTEHKGTITVESEPGQGATFLASLPAAAEAAEEFAAELPTQPFLLARKKILICSDDAALCDSLEDILKPAGALLEINPSNEEGLAKCLSGGYDLVFAEWGGTGESQLTDWLSAERAQLASRCILLANKASLEEAKRFCEQSGASWLQKPVMFAELRIVVEKTLRLAATGKQPSS